MPAITVGAGAIDRGYEESAGYTFLCKDGPANVSGIISTVNIFVASEDMVGAKVGIFYLVSDTTYKCRSAVTIGNLPADTKSTSTGQNLAVVAGDLIGIYFSAGKIKRDTDVGTGSFYTSGDKVTVDNESAYSSETGAISLDGSGALATRGWMSK
jgi:hypothetical protein